MTFLPIVLRELRVAARRRGTYLGRLGAAVTGIGVLVWMLFTVGQNSFMQAQLGTYTFTTLTFFSFAYCLLAGIRATADCLAEEKREGTLGLLFLTDLRGYDVVFGKLAATSLSAFYGLLAVLPVLTVPLLLGGVAGDKVWRTALMLLNTLFFSLAVGMWVSSVSRNERKAAGGTTLALTLITGGWPALWAYVLYKIYGDTTPSEAMFLPMAPSPGFAFAVLDRGGNAFWCSMGATHALSWLFLALASWRLPHSWQEGGVSARRERMEKRMNELAFGRSEAQRHFRTRMLNVNPVLWVNARNRLGPRLVWGMLALGAFIWAWGLIKNPRDFLDTSSYIITALLLHGALGVWFATEACKRFAEDRRSGALELLLSTPLTDAEIFRGQRLSLRRQFGGPVLAVLALDLLFIALGGTWSWRNSPLQGEDFRVYVLVFICGMAVMIADLLAMTWLGMWAGLTAPTTNRAGGIVIGRVLILPWGAFALICSVLIPLFAFSRTNFGPEWFVLGWAAINLLNDLLWYLWARSQLHTRFRAVATERFDAATGLFARIGRTLGRLYGASRASSKRGKKAAENRP